MTENGLQELFDRNIGMALTLQCAFADTVPDPFWQWKHFIDDELSYVEFPNLGRYQMQVLGSESLISNSWLAAWANKELEDPYVTTSLALKDLAAQLEEERIGGPQYALNIVNGDYIGAIATSLYEGAAYTAIPTFNEEKKHIGDSFRIFFDLPLINMSPIPMSRMSTVIEMMTQSPQIQDFELAVRSYLESAEFSLAETTEDTETFLDELGRAFVLEWSRNGKEFNIDWAVTNADLVQQPEHSEDVVNRQWDYFVRAPLSRVADDYFEPGP